MGDDDNDGFINRLKHQIIKKRKIRTLKMDRLIPAR